MGGGVQLILKDLGGSQQHFLKLIPPSWAKLD